MSTTLNFDISRTLFLFTAWRYEEYLKSYSYVWTGTLYRVSLHVQFKYLTVFLPHVQYLPVRAKGLILVYLILDEVRACDAYATGLLSCHNTAPRPTWKASICNTTSLVVSKYQRDILTDLNFNLLECYIMCLRSLKQCIFLEQTSEVK